jgi:hypothetical protein
MPHTPIPATPRNTNNAAKRHPRFFVISLSPFFPRFQVRFKITLHNKRTMTDDSLALVFFDRAGGDAHHGLKIMLVARL